MKLRSRKLRACGAQRRKPATVTLAAVDELAERDDVTRSEAIRRLIELALAVKAKKQNSDK
jgi:hypothetical protein